MLTDKGSIDIALQLSGVMKFVANTTLAAEVSAQVETMKLRMVSLSKKASCFLIGGEKIKERLHKPGKLKKRGSIARV